MTVKFKTIPINNDIELLQKKGNKVFCHIVQSCIGRDLNLGPSSFLATYLTT